MAPDMGLYFGAIFEATRRAPIMGARLVASFLGPEYGPRSGPSFFTVLNAVRSRRTDSSHTEAKTIPHAGEGFAQGYCMFLHQLCFAAYQHTQPQSRITETLRSRRFLYRSLLGLENEMLKCVFVFQILPHERYHFHRAAPFANHPRNQNYLKTSKVRHA